MSAKTFLVIFLVVFSKFTKAGSIITNITSIPSFGNVYPYNSSSSLNYSVSGTSLTAPIVISSSAAFEVSLNYNYGYGNKITLTPLAGTIANTKIFVRFSPTLVASYPSTSNAILNSSIGSASVSVSVSGTCIATTIPTGVNTYFNTIGNVRGAALKTALYNKISVGATSVSYTPGVWNAYATTDVQPNGKVWDIYSTRLDQASPYEYTLVSNQCGTYSVEGNCYNREHSFPQSWFNSASPMVTELNHVFASDGKVNGMRNNYPYGYVTNATYTSLYGGKLGTSTNNFGYTGVVFEPIDEYKGDLARGYFFMATRYENLIASWTSNAGATDILAGNNYPVFKPWQLSLLLSWHNLDPVSDKEIKRNNAIAAIQGNRNPFIDSPQYAQRIWGGAIHNEPTIASTDFSYTNNGTNTVNLSWKTGNGVRRLVICKAGSAVNSLPIDTVAYTANSVFGSGSNLGNNCFVVYNGTGSSCDVTGLNNTTSYYFAIVEYNGVSNISNYNTTTYFNSGIVSLPVKWLSLNAKFINPANVLINWKTASEINNNKFEVEKSYDGNNWIKISEVKGAGNSNSIKSYNITDEIGSMNSNNILYYRIKQIDFDGNFSYSRVEKVAKITSEKVVVSPNPFTNFLNINIFSETGSSANITLLNNWGSKVINYEANLIIGDNLIEIPEVQKLSNGIYILQIESGSNVQTFKCIKN